MKVKEGLILKEVGGAIIVVAVGETAKNFNGMLKLNKTSKFLWNLLKIGSTREELIDKLLETYDVDKAMATKDVDKFLDVLIANDLLEK